MYRSQHRDDFAGRCSMKDDSKTALSSAAAKLREISLAAIDGALLDSEERLVTNLGFSRSTVRQAARLLEREGLLRVKRGPSGGYFAARPDARTIENAVSSYLSTLDISLHDVTIIATALWIEVVRKAASNGGGRASERLGPWRERVQSFDLDASLDDVRMLEGEYRGEIFALADSKYVELIFSINTAFAGNAAKGGPLHGGSVHRELVGAWKDARLLELTAIAEGDVELACLAARRVRQCWRMIVGVDPLSAPALS